MTIRRWAVALVTVIVLLVLAPGAWNLAATSLVHRRNPVPGAMYSIGEYRMHIVCTGSGAPAIVLESAASASWMAWRNVQPMLSKQTRVCSYDRAGHGWSDVRPGPRDADHIAIELHDLLDSAQVQRPLVLVGHSAGGLYVREFARRFPSEVAAMALLDASSPDQLAALPTFRASYEEGLREYAANRRREKLRLWSGWARLKGECGIGDSNESAEINGQYAAMMCRPAFAGGEDIEYPYFAQTLQQAGRLARLEKLPLLIVSRDPAAESDTSAKVRAEEAAWGGEQEKAKALSPLSWRVIAKGSGHGVHHDRLDLVAEQLTLLLAYMKGGSAPPFGTTVMK